MKRNRVKESLRVSYWDGLFSSAMQGLVADYVTPFALWLKATTGQIGLLTAFSSLASSLVQLKAADITEWAHSRKRIVVLFVYLQALTFLPVILIPLVFREHAVFALIVCNTLFNGFAALAGPAWASLMAEYVPYKKRGRYFGWRAMVMGPVAVIFSFISGIILYLFKGNQLAAFIIIFSSAFLCRLASWYFLTRMYEPGFNMGKENTFSFVRFLVKIRESNFAKFVVFVAFFLFSVNLASPFFSVFMLRDLKFNYLTYTILIAAVTCANIFTINRWGTFADRVGNLRIMRFTAFFIASLPILWIINRHPVFLFGAQLVSGFAWAGFNLCVSNFIYDAVSAPKRTRCIAYFNVVAGIATFFGAVIGGYAVNFLPPLFGYRMLSLFLIAGIMRFCVAGMLFRKIKEVRNTEHISSRELFYSMVGLNPLLGAAQGVRKERE